MLAQVIISYFADKYIRIFTLKRIVIALCLLCFPVTIWFYFTEGSLLKAMVVLAFFGGCVNGAAAFVNTIAARFADAGRKLRFSYARGIGSISWGIASVIISYVVDNTHVEIILFLQAAMLLFMIMAVLALEPVPLPIQAEKTEAKSHSYLYLLSHNIGFSIFLLSSILLFLGYTLQTVFLIDIVTNVGGGNVELGYVELVQSVCELLPAVLYVWMIKKRSSYQILRICGVACFAMIFSVMMSGRVIHLMLLQLFDIFGYGMYWPVSVDYISQTIDKNDWVKGQALICVCSLGAGGTIGSIFGGSIMQVAGIEGLLKISTGLALLGVILMFVAMWMDEKKSRRLETS